MAKTIMDYEMDHLKKKAIEQQVANDIMDLLIEHHWTTMGSMIIDIALDLIKEKYDIKPEFDLKGER